MTVEQTAAYLGMSRTNFYRLLRVGNGPPESKVVPHRFLVDDVDKWLGKAA
jgi:predicted DNA-binding transcriptional regulator AlpA